MVHHLDVPVAAERLTLRNRALDPGAHRIPREQAQQALTYFEQPSADEGLTVCPSRERPLMPIPEIRPLRGDDWWD